MQKISTVLVGVTMIALGIFSLAFNMLVPSLGWLAPWRFWPLIILGCGSVLFLIALLSIRRPALGALFIPAVPLNMVGAILLYASVFDQWHVWSFAWSLVVLAVAVGFLLAMVFARVIWYGIPMILIGLNGLLLAFCSLTGLWSWWSVLWTIEPFAVGLVLLLVSYKTRSSTVAILGLVACAFAAFSFMIMSELLVMGSWFFRLSGPALLVLLGIVLLGWGVIRRPLTPIAE